MPRSAVIDKSRAFTACVVNGENVVFFTMLKDTEMNEGLLLNAFII